MLAAFDGGHSLCLGTPGPSSVKRGLGLRDLLQLAESEMLKTRDLGQSRSQQLEMSLIGLS